jgi:hypothetical protein
VFVEGATKSACPQKNFDYMISRDPNALLFKQSVYEVSIKETMWLDLDEFALQDGNHHCPIVVVVVSEKLDNVKIDCWGLKIYELTH